MQNQNQTSRIVVFSAVLAITLMFGGRHCCWGASDNDQDLYRLGSAHYSRGQWDFAIQRFEELLKNGSDESLKALSKFYLAESLVAAKELNKAQIHLQQFLERHADHQFANQAMFRLGEVSYLLGHTDLATTALQKFAKENPNHELLEFALPYLGEIALKKGNLKSAASLFEKSLRQSPNGRLAHEARFGLARALEKNGAVKEAFRFYRFLIDHPESERAADSLLQIGKLYYRQQELAKAQQAFREFETKHPSSDLANPVRYWQGRIHFDQADYSGAASYYEAALKDNPVPKIIPALRFELARCLNELNRFADAIVHLQIIHAEYPRSDWGDDALLLNVQILRNNKQFESALRLCRKFHIAFTESELNRHVLDSEAECRFALNHFVAAEKLFSRLVTVYAVTEDDSQNEKNRFENWRYKLAVSQIKLSKQREALYNLQAIRLENCDEETRSATVLATATIHIERNQLSQACKGLIEFVNLNPDSEAAAKCKVDIALLFAKRENFHAAEQWAKKVESDRSRADTYLQIAEIAFAAKQYVFASKWFSAASRIAGPIEIRCRASMGQIWALKELGNIESAIAAIDRLIGSFPDCRQAPEALYLKAVLLERSGAQKQSIPVFEMMIARYSGSKHVEQSLLSLASLYRTYDSKKLADLEIPLSQQIASARSKQTDLLLYELGWILKENGKLEKSSRCFEELVTRFPRHRNGAEALLQIAINELQGSNPASGKKRLMALSQSQASPQVLVTANYELGRIAFSEKRFDQAFKFMTLVWQRFPTSPQAAQARYWAAEARYQAGKVGEAKKLFSALENSLNEDSKFSDRVQLRLAQTNIKLKNWERAREIAEQLVTKTPCDVPASDSYFVIGRACSGLGLFSKARSAFHKVLLDPKQKGSETAAISQWMIGETFFHQEDFQAAIDAYQRAEILHAFPEWQAASLLQAGKCFERLDRMKNAIESYQRLIKRYADSRFVSEAKERLQILGQITTAQKTQPSNHQQTK